MEEQEKGQCCPGAGGGHQARTQGGATESEIQKAVEFKVDGNRCYKEKKFREAIGKYHRALLQLKGVQGRAGAASLEQNLLDPPRCPLTEEQLRLVESTEVECYDSLTGRCRPAAAELGG
nr:tetratricopeptide repeat protein 9B-like [Chelonoidis abingdonii]